MEPTDIGLGPGRQGAVDLPALSVRRAARLLCADGTGRRRGAIDGHGLLRIDQVQRQPLPPRAVIVVRVRVIVDAVLAEAPCPLEMPPSQPRHDVEANVGVRPRRDRSRRGHDQGYSTAHNLTEWSYRNYNGAMHNQLTESRRQEIFLALVTAQDHDMSVSESRKLVAQRFGISEDAVLKIEREGIENNWPPLSEW